MAALSQKFKCSIRTLSVRLCSSLLYFMIIAAQVPPTHQLDGNSNTASPVEGKQAASGASSTPSKEDLYIRLFRQQRGLHREALKSIISLPSYEKQHQMISLVLDKLFKVMEDSKVKLTGAGYVPGESFPEDDSVRDALSKVAENTAFFGDLVLRLPDVTHKLYDRKKEWNLLLQWGLTFCNSTGLFKDENRHLLRLMAQELNLIERDVTYINPYSEKYQKEKAMKEQEARPKPPAKKKKKRARGPQLSRAEL